jgi:hypothetical protein
MECPFSEHVGIRWNKTAAGSVSLFEALRKAQDEAGQMTRHQHQVCRGLTASGGRSMNISHKPVILCFVFTVLGSTLAFANPTARSEDGCRSHEKKAAACHVPISKPGAATGCARCRLPNAPKDDWPAGMFLGDAGLVLTLQHRLNA